jgi:hypothetical protein
MLRDVHFVGLRIGRTVSLKSGMPDGVDALSDCV